MTIDEVIGHLLHARSELLEGGQACDLASAVPYPYQTTLQFIETSLLWAYETKRRAEMSGDYMSKKNEHNSSK